MVGKNVFQNVKSHIDHDMVKMSYALVFSRALYIATFFSLLVPVWGKNLFY